MKNAILVATAALASALMGSTAMAAGSNTLNLLQDGDLNTATVNQSGGNNNDFGVTGPATQDGDHNFLTFGNYGWGVNNDNDIDKFLQQGNWNIYEGSAAGESSGNDLNDFKQLGNGNQARISWTQNDTSTVDTVLMQGNRNTLTITQNNNANSGANNYVGLAKILGNFNGISSGNQYSHSNNDAAIHIVQYGSGNHVASSTVEGDYNRAASPYAVGAFNKVHFIRQTGLNNGQLFSNAATLGSNGNWIKVTQTGDSNNFDLSQGISTSSTQNFIALVQTGNDNMATVKENGSYNNVNASQIGNENVITANITGNNNGSGVFTNAGASALALGSGLLSGDIFQSGDDHTVTLTIGTSQNQFAFSQKGGNGNSITGTISGGNGNQAVGLQDGDSNTATFGQNGASNVAVFSQVGDSNSTTITQ